MANIVVRVSHGWCRSAPACLNVRIDVLGACHMQRNWDPVWHTIFGCGSCGPGLVMGVLLKHFDVMLSVHADAVATGTTVFVSALLFGLLYVPKPTNAWTCSASRIEHRRTLHMVAIGLVMDKNFAFGSTLVVRVCTIAFDVSILLKLLRPPGVPN